MVQRSLVSNRRRAMLGSALVALGGGFSGVATASSDQPDVITCAQYPMKDEFLPEWGPWRRRYLLRARAGDEVTFIVTDVSELGEPGEQKGTWVVRTAPWDGTSRNGPDWDEFTVYREGSLADASPATVTIPFESDANVALLFEYNRYIEVESGEWIDGGPASGTVEFTGSARCETGSTAVTSVPTLSGAGLLATGGLVVLVAGYLRRRQGGGK